MSRSTELAEKLTACPPGKDGWKQFEDICLEILCHLFVPPLNGPKVQPKTYSGIDRRDAVFPNRNIGINNMWGHLIQELDARMILCEFKNYDFCDIGKEEVNQTSCYMTQPMGKLAIIVCNKTPEKDAHIKRNTIFSAEKKVILFLTKEHLIEMLYIKERGEEPGDLIMDLIEWFYLQHE